MAPHRERDAPQSVASGALRETAARARRWLFEDALPLWATVGHDEAHGGFFEHKNQKNERSNKIKKNKKKQKQKGHNKIKKLEIPENKK
jgi:hypothetical protein